VPGENGELRAVWIDSEMRAFEQQMTRETSAGALVDEPGGSKQRSLRSPETDVIELYKRP